MENLLSRWERLAEHDTTQRDPLRKSAYRRRNGETMAQERAALKSERAVMVRQRPLFGAQRQIGAGVPRHSKQTAGADSKEALSSEPPRCHLKTTNDLQQQTQSANGVQWAERIIRKIDNVFSG